MPPTSKLELFQYQPETINEVRQYFNVDGKEIQQNIEILKNWLKQQKHLPQTVDDDFLERMLLRNKFRVEQTKAKLDGYFTIRGLYFQKIFNDQPKIVPSKEIGKILVLPKLTKSNERILYFYKSSTDLMDRIRQIFYLSQICELSLFNDYNVGDHFVFDFKNYTMNDLSNWTASRLLQFWNLYMKAYSGRVLSIIGINPKPFTSKFMDFAKTVLPKEIVPTVRSYDNLDDFYESIPKNLLPSDIGGELQSVKELEQQMDVVFDQEQNFFEQTSKQISNEKLRIGEFPYSDLFEMEGNLKKLKLIRINQFVIVGFQ